LCKTPGQLSILFGTHRYRCHDLAESGFRSCFCEPAHDFVLLEPQSTFESDAITRELTEKLIAQHADLYGLSVCGGGIGGDLAALRAGDRRGRVVTVGYDLLDATRAGLLDGSLTQVISHPFAAIAQQTIEALIRGRDMAPGADAPSALVPFEIHTAENL
jgi:LacI family transcriptional regulator